MKNKILIVGKNSRLWKILKPKMDFDFTEVSHTELATFELKDSFDSAIVFSYSKKKNDNSELLSAISIYSEEIVYISTVSASYAENGYKYQYPNVKLHCENYLREKKCFKKTHIIRLGLILETYKPLNLSGRYCITSIEKLSIHINQIVSKEANLVEFSETKTFEHSNRVEKAIYRIYKKLSKPSFISFMLTRPLDLIIKKLGFNWYGYNEKI